ncbi:MAG: hypothetical protein ABSD03_11065 [Vulcanimicrobiaceae bacterium]
MTTTDPAPRVRHYWRGCRTVDAERREFCACGETYPLGATCPALVTVPRVLALAEQPQ